ncbi:MAG: hypothetical protein IT314_06275 [Anaerolineales bacterium]|nr:hypothetical protein [Anaerolineales bacterium]
MDAGEQLNETHLVKLCSNGKQLWRVQFGQSGQIGYDPNQGVIWAPELNDINSIHYDQLVKVDADGAVADRLQGYRTSILGVDPRDGALWAQRLLLPPGDSQYISQIAKLSPQGELLFAMDAAPSVIYTLALDPRNGTVWIGGHGYLIHLSSEREVLFKAADVRFFSNGPHQIAVNRSNGDIWHTTMEGELYRRSWDGTVRAKIGGFNEPIAIAVHPLDGSAWVADYDQTGAGSVAKISRDGKILFEMDTPNHAHVVGVNPHDGVIWVGYEGGILLLNREGKLLDTLHGFQKPISLAFGESHNELGVIFNCLIK